MSWKRVTIVLMSLPGMDRRKMCLMWTFLGSKWSLYSFFSQFPMTMLKLSSYSNRWLLVEVEHYRSSCSTQIWSVSTCSHWVGRYRTHHRMVLWRGELGPLVLVVLLVVLWVVLAPVWQQVSSSPIYSSNLSSPQVCPYADCSSCSQS